jgi:spore maturation protein CgeB
MSDHLHNDAVGPHCIGYLGADWWGSDARALAGELRAMGHLLIERHYEDYLPTKWRSFPLRAIRRLARPWISAEYNRSVRELLEIEALDFLLVFKGVLLDETTLREFRLRGKPCYCVYPDVSFQAHGVNIWACLPHYDCVFTTKSYHLEDPRVQARSRQLKFVPHGFDQDVHRPVALSKRLRRHYECDVSFVGVWSPKKEQAITAIVRGVPGTSVNIWGPYWDRACNEVRACWRKRSAHGDELAAIYCSSRINLGLLSEAGPDGRQGDLTTARTWQIPASGGFMLHEDTLELRSAFEPDYEVAVFQNHEALVREVRRYLGDSIKREEILKAGQLRCIKSQYTYRTAAHEIIAYHERDCRV